MGLKKGTNYDRRSVENSNLEGNEINQQGGEAHPVQMGSSKSFSYKDACIHSDTRWRNCIQEWGLHDLGLELEESTTEMMADVDDGTPMIDLDADTQKNIIQPWKYCLISKVVRKMMGFKYLSLKVNELWKLNGKVQILDLGCDFFLFKFDNPYDYRFALLEGPWFIGGHHLSMRIWTPNFKPSETSVHTTVVWVRLPELPLEYFDKTVLEKVGAKIGRLIKVDSTTELVLRDKFSIVCVEVTNDKPLLPFVRIGSIKQKIEYEGVNMICFHYGKMSHKKEKCPLIIK
ncbi:hypothetical protein MKX01_022781 [Papaver californicum]|nr:hypothetical protein MKX01_022781 [Papaver californicum]